MGTTAGRFIPPPRPAWLDLSPAERIVLAALRQAVYELESGRRLDVALTTGNVSSEGDRWTFNLQFKPKS